MEADSKSSNRSNVLIVPCSGIGKTYGSVSRLAAYIVTEDLLPDQTSLMALSRLVMGEQAARQEVAACPAITIDGCSLACATKMVQESAGTVAQAFAVLEVYRRNRQLKPKGIADLNEAGEKLAQVLAEEIRLAVVQPTKAAQEKSHG
jgi:uncharacterized metal-binding protein